MQDVDVPVTLCDFHFTTIGGSLSLSPYVADFLGEVRRRKLRYNLHALGTNIEAPLPELCSLADWLINYLRSSGEKRVFIDMRIATRFDRTQDIAEKIKAVSDKLEGQP